MVLNWIVYKPWEHKIQCRKRVEFDKPPSLNIISNLDPFLSWSWRSPSSWHATLIQCLEGSFPEVVHIDAYAPMQQLAGKLLERWWTPHESAYMRLLTMGEVFHCRCTGLRLLTKRTIHYATWISAPWSSISIKALFGHHVATNSCFVRTVGPKWCGGTCLNFLTSFWGRSGVGIFLRKSRA